MHVFKWDFARIAQQYALVPLELVVELGVEVHAADVAQDEVLGVAPEELGLQAEEALPLEPAVVLGEVPVGRGQQRQEGHHPLQGGHLPQEAAGRRDQPHSAFLRAVNPSVGMSGLI